MLRIKFFIKKIIKVGYVIVAELLGIGLLMRLNISRRKRLAVLTYHKITDDCAQSYYCVTKSNFENQIKYLKKRFNITSIDDVIDYLKGRLWLEMNSCCITFDDGYKDIYRHVFPIIKKNKFPIAVGLVSDYVDRNREFSWDRAFHLKDKEILAWAQIKELMEWQVNFGSHSSTHANLASLNEEGLRYEIMNSKYVIENILKKDTDFFIYPFGSSTDIIQRAVAMVREAGYSIALTSIWGWVDKDSNPYMLKRINIDGSDTMLTFKAKLSGTFNILGIFDSCPFEFIRGIAKQIFK